MHIRTANFGTALPSSLRARSWAPPVFEIHLPQARIALPADDQDPSEWMHAFSHFPSPTSLCAGQKRRSGPLVCLASSEKGQISRSFLFCRVKGAAAVCTDGVVGGPAPGPNRAFAVLRPCLAVMETGPPEAQVPKA